MFLYFVSDHNVSSRQDFPNEIGSQSNLTRSDVGVELTSPSESYYDLDQHWEMNYHEAAIFLEVDFAQANFIKCVVEIRKRKYSSSFFL